MQYALLGKYLDRTHRYHTFGHRGNTVGFELSIMACREQAEMNKKKWRYRVIQGRSIAKPRRCRAEARRWCGDPQGYIMNGCGFRQCKSGKNRLNCSEEDEQLACVSVHCKLTTRATHLDAYSGSGIERIKGDLFSESIS